VEDDQVKYDVHQFRRDRIDTVPHLEALLLLWNSRRAVDSGGHGDLFVAPDVAGGVLYDMARQRLIVMVPGACKTYRYEPQRDRDQLVAAVESTYREELIGYRD
jgi:hypothetical protein